MLHITLAPRAYIAVRIFKVPSRIYEDMYICRGRRSLEMCSSVAIGGVLMDPGCTASEGAGGCTVPNPRGGVMARSPAVPPRIKQEQQRKRP